MSAASFPLVSVGVPVFNGENYLAEAIESILAQTVTDLELIICDNASTDATEEIVRRFAESDERIRYFRNPKNLGVSPNVNLCCRHATGRYFKLLSHDDTIAPDCLEKTVAVLESDPDVVICHSLVELIDENGTTLDIHDSKLTNLDSASAADRFATLILDAHQCLELDGLIRMDMLARTALMPSFPGADRALLCELGILGKIIRLKEPIFRTREHPERFRRYANTPELRLATYDTSRSGEKCVATWELYRDYWRMVKTHVTDGGERRRSYAALLRWWLVNWNTARVAVDVIALVAPGLLVWSERFKQKFVRPEPGPNPGGTKRPS